MNIEILSLISLMPLIDKFITCLLMNIKFTKKFSRYFSIYILYFNFFVNFIYLILTSFYNLFFIRYLIELVFINIFFKSFLDRERPYKSLLINNYEPIYKMKITKNWRFKQSFPSGHVTTIYTTYFILKLMTNNIYIINLYKLLIITTSFCRINLGMHHFSDCVFAILISKYLFTTLLPNLKI